MVAPSCNARGSSDYAVANVRVDKDRTTGEPCVLFDGYVREDGAWVYAGAFTAPAGTHAAHLWRIIDRIENDPGR